MRVLVIDDDKLVCVSLKTILESQGDINVIGTGNSGQEALELFQSLNPDILLMDIRMDGMTGLEAAETILNNDKNAKILFLTTFSDDDYIVKALKIGAKGYIIKQNFECIVPSLKAVYSGQSVFGDDIVSKIPSLINNTSKVDFFSFGITEKELEIITLVADGLSNKEISSNLYLSEGTVRNTITIILQKLSLRDRTQLAIFYYKNKS
ncbi:MULTISPECIES: response regulator transcription factor [Clostridium]|uniref:response regulator transcription factor n=1 Tax=Clostridium TaxID=1485 RepID=UPI000421A1AE|nr:response regulator transcription factor [Clostridium cadaveris]MDM8311246.1 response regulator transcription factor [Clostridium cadaveris]MDU4951908.1 response regulator transcription factor [Clostridium sp.]NME64228.1 response regulator transcription factor [Clostridium cadaveris]UFH65912.1 response regulator transcription factor [Clostridium cadaveris]